MLTGNGSPARSRCFALRALRREPARAARIPGRPSSRRRQAQGWRFGQGSGERASIGLLGANSLTAGRSPVKGPGRLRAAWNAGIIVALMAKRSSPKTAASRGLAAEPAQPFPGEVHARDGEGVEGFAGPNATPGARRRGARLRQLQCAGDWLRPVRTGVGGRAVAGADAAMGDPVFPAGRSEAAGSGRPVARLGHRTVRNVRLASAADLDTPAVRTLIRTALERAKVPIDATGRRRMVIKSISAKQRPRRPS